eukprot:354880-Chlamydomonas_euryale.AAC.9
MDGWMDGWMDAWMHGWMHGWMDGWMDGWAQVHARRHVRGACQGCMHARYACLHGARPCIRSSRLTRVVLEVIVRVQRVLGVAERHGVAPLTGAAVAAGGERRRATPGTGNANLPPHPFSQAPRSLRPGLAPSFFLLSATGGSSPLRRVRGAADGAERAAAARIAIRLDVFRP